MIESVEFRNFKALRKTTLPLGRFTLIVGPNGSGKSTALQAFQAVTDPNLQEFSRIVTGGLPSGTEATVEIKLHWDATRAGMLTSASWSAAGSPRHIHFNRKGTPTQEEIVADAAKNLTAELRRIRVYSFDHRTIAAPVQLEPNTELGQDGAGLAGVLIQLHRDRKRFEALEQELGRLIPEFEHIAFGAPKTGHVSFSLKTRGAGNEIQAADLSQGTLLALALLTLAYLPAPPPIVCLEEPDRGIHPRLLRDLQDVFYRLSYPENFGEKRQPVQVVATTHSPYLLDLYRDHPEEVVIAQKTGQEVKFERLSDQPYIDEILRDSHLGEIWYTGILGGVPAQP